MAFSKHAPMASNLGPPRRRPSSRTARACSALLIFLAAFIGAARATRPTLDQQQHVVVLNEVGLARPAPIEAHGQASVSAGRTVRLLGQNGRSFHCKLSGGRAGSQLRVRGGDAVPTPEEKEAREQQIRKRKAALMVARWAPLRFRCHTWRETPNKEDPPDSSGEGQIPWSFRWCFNAEAMMWAPLPWLQRHSLGWHDEAMDESHDNGSLTLHYVNGSEGRSAKMRCDCGHGPHNVSSWDVNKSGSLSTLVVSMPSCCSFRREDGKRWPLLETFQWLISPLHHLPCHPFRVKSMLYELCPGSDILRSRPFPNISGSDFSAADDPAGDDALDTTGVELEQLDTPTIQTRRRFDDGWTDENEANEYGDMIDLDTDDLEYDGIALVQGEATVFPGAEGMTLDELDQMLEENITGALVLGAGIMSIRLVPARPAVETFGSDRDEEAEVAGSILPSAVLAEALATGRGRKHRAIEVVLNPGAPCTENGKVTAEPRQTLVRWICPAHWRSKSPQREDGHSALIAIEHPTSCTTVAWMSSMLLCGHDQLFPPPAEPSHISCEVHAATDTNSMQADAAAEDTAVPQRWAAPPPDRLSEDAVEEEEDEASSIERKQLMAMSDGSLIRQLDTMGVSDSDQAKLFQLPNFKAAIIDYILVFESQGKQEISSTERRVFMIKVLKRYHARQPSAVAEELAFQELEQLQLEKLKKQEEDLSQSSIVEAKANLGGPRPSKHADSVDGKVASFFLESPLPRTGIAFWIGQVVENLDDGILGAIVGWERDMSTSSVRYLLLVDRRHRPMVGALPPGSLGLPGRAAWVPEASLRTWHGPRTATPPMELPPKALGQVFHAWSADTATFLPADWLQRRFPADLEAAAAAAAASHVGKDLHHVKGEQKLDTLSAIMALEDRIDKAHKIVSGQQEGVLQRKKEELGQKLGDLTKLQAKLKLLNDMQTAMKSADTSGLESGVAELTDLLTKSASSSGTESGVAEASTEMGDSPTSQMRKMLQAADRGIESSSSSSTGSSSAMEDLLRKALGPDPTDALGAGPSSARGSSESVPAQGAAAEVTAAGSGAGPGVGSGEQEDEEALSIVRKHLMVMSSSKLLKRLQTIGVSDTDLAKLFEIDDFKAAMVDYILMFESHGKQEISSMERRVLMLRVLHQSRDRQASALAEALAAQEQEQLQLKKLKKQEEEMENNNKEEMRSFQRDQQVKREKAAKLREAEDKETAQELEEQLQQLKTGSAQRQEQLWGALKEALGSEVTSALAEQEGTPQGEYAGNIEEGASDLEARLMGALSKAFAMEDELATETPPDDEGIKDAASTLAGALAEESEVEEVGRDAELDVRAEL